MHLLAKTLLGASLALLASTSASANQVGPGNFSGGYIGSVKSVVATIIGVSYSIHPTYAGCTQGLTNIQTNVWASSGVVLQVIPCSYVPGKGTAVEMTPDPMSPERVMGGLQQTQELRDRYNIDAYEIELEAIWQSEPADGSH